MTRGQGTPREERTRRPPQRKGQPDASRASARGFGRQLQQRPTTCLPPLANRLAFPGTGRRTRRPQTLRRRRGSVGVGAALSARRRPRCPRSFPRAKMGGETQRPERIERLWNCENAALCNCTIPQLHNGIFVHFSLVSTALSVAYFRRCYATSFGITIC